MELKTGISKLYHALDDLITDHAEQSFPILMIILGGIGLIALVVGGFLWKIVGLIAIAYAVREFRRCMKARKAGEEYVPTSAKVTYVLIFVVVLWLLWYVFIGVNSPENHVKEITLNGFDHSIGYLVERNLDDVKWKTKKEDGDTYVYVYGTTDHGEDIALEFLYTKEDGHYMVEVTDGSIEGSWGGWLFAMTILSELDS